MELHSLQVFLTVATEKSFSRAAEKLLRTQPAISLALQRLEQELGEKLIDRSGKDLILTDAGRTVLDYARRFQSLHQEMDNSHRRTARQFGRAPDHRRQRIHHAVSAAAHRALPRAVPEGEGAGAAQPIRARCPTSCWTATWNWA